MISKELFWQLVRFGIVGCMNTGISLAVIYALMFGNVCHYQGANVIGYGVGLINSFIWSKWWVFRKKEGNLWRELIVFFAIFVICFGIQFWLLLLFVEHWEMNAYIAQPIAMVVYTLLNFILNRTITFGRKPTENLS